MSKKIAKTTLDKAHLMFMDFKQPSLICRELKMPRSSLDYHIKKSDGWELERNLKSAELFEQLNASRKRDFTTMTQATIDVLSKALINLASRNRPPTMQEARGAANILEVLDRITRLDTGSPTDIIANEKPSTIIEVREMLKVDPFTKIEEVEEIEYKEKK